MRGGGRHHQADQKYYSDHSGGVNTLQNLEDGLPDPFDGPQKSAHEGKDEGRPGEGPACSLLGGVLYPLPPLPAGFRMLWEPPGEELLFASFSLQDGFKTRWREDDIDKTMTRRYEGVLKGYKRALRGLQIAT